MNRDDAIFGYHARPMISRGWALFALLTTSLALLAQQPDSAALHAGPVIISGTELERYEFWDFFRSATGQNNYSYSGALLQLAFSQTEQKYDWTVDFAAPVLLGLPSQAVRPAPVGQLGLGGAYYAANSNSKTAAGFFAKQGFVRFRLRKSTLQLGRFEFADGMEGKPVDATLTALRASRIQQRLIGPFGFSDVRRSFDGAHYEWASGGWNVTGVSAIPTRGVFQTDGWGWVRTPFAYVAATRDVKHGNSGAEWRLFAVYYNDNRAVVKTDNRSVAVRAGDLSNINIGTWGAHYIQDFATNAGIFDVLGWAAIQTGSWGNQTQKSGAIATEAGFQPNIVKRLAPWFRAGYFWSSGDSNPNDNTHGTFFSLLPTPRVYARFPFYNAMNNRDAFGEVLVRPHKKVTIRGDAHGVWLSSANDLWYSGGGAFQPWTFGVNGRPSGGQTKLANIYDTSADFQLNRSVSLGLYFGYAQGGAVIQKIFPRDHNARFGYIEINYAR